MARALSKSLPLPRPLVVGWFATALLAWGILLATLPGYYRWFFRQPVVLQFDLTQRVAAYASGVASLICALTSLALAALLFLRKPGDRAALFFSFYLLLYGIIMAGPLEVFEFQYFDQWGLISVRIQAILFAAPTAYLLFIFPNGVIIPPWLRWTMPVLVAIMLAMVFLPYDEINTLTSLRSQVIYSLLTITYLGALGAQVYRYQRVSTPLERQQTKIFIFGLALQIVFFVISSSTYFQDAEARQGDLAPQYVVLSLFWWVSVAIMPVSLTIAVVRSHLWDIDVVIRRTLVYGFLTAALALVYFASVVTLQSLARLMIGHDTQLSIVISTLGIAALFTPLRSRIQAAIDRRFFRSKYNAEQALARFQRTLRDRIELDQVERELTTIVQATVQPEWITLWVRPPAEEDASRSTPQ